MKTPSRLRSRRGSLLIVALIFSAVIAVVLTSYLRMSTTALNLSQRAFYENQAMNLTESGLEMGMAAINANTWSSPWTTSGSDAIATYSGFTLMGNASGQVKVYVQNYAGSSPLVVAKGIVTPGTGSTLYKMVEISGIVQRSLFAKGLVGRNGVSFNGNNPSVDAWDSNPTAAASGSYTPVAYSSSVKDDKGSIAAVNVTATDAVGNADIWGTASVGGSSASAISVGPQGVVGPFGTPNGTKDANSISTNFTDNLPSVSAPTPPSAAYNLGTINSATTLPRGTDSAQSDGKYYYTVSSLTFAGNSDYLQISAGANVVLLFSTASGSDAIRITGSHAYIGVASTGSLAIYTAGNISISGNGVVNSNSTGNASNVGIWSTNTNDPAVTGSVAQSISISGNGSLAATVYAPNASVSAQGGGNSGSVYGAIVGYSINMSGNDSFHYDENLGRQGNAGNFSPTKWRELVNDSDRSTYASHF